MDALKKLHRNFCDMLLRKNKKFVYNSEDNTFFIVKAKSSGVYRRTTAYFTSDEKEPPCHMAEFLTKEQYFNLKSTDTDELLQMLGSARIILDGFIPVIESEIYILPGIVFLGITHFDRLFEVDKDGNVKKVT